MQDNKEKINLEKDNNSIENKDDSKNLEKEITNELEDLKKSFQEEKDDLIDKLKRTQADFINYKNRVVKEKEHDIFNNTSKFLKDFLQFRETLKKAYEIEENEISKQNINHLIENYDHLLKRSGLEKLDVLDTDFDFSLAECVLREKVESKEKIGKVIKILEDGYSYKNKIIKPAKVIVGYMEE